MQNATKAYLSTQVTTTSQADLLILLYDGAIKYLAQAKEAIGRKDIKAKGQLLGRASDVINELQSSLNKEKGGEIAENLSRLYFYCNSRLLMANLKLDCEAIDQVVNILKGLRSAYAEIRDLTPSPQAPVQAAAPQTARPVNLGMAAAATAAAVRARQAGAYQANAAPQPAPVAPSAAAPAQAAATPEAPRAPGPDAAPDTPQAAATAEQPPSAEAPAQSDQRTLSLHLKRATAAYGSTSAR